MGSENLITFAFVFLTTSVFLASVVGVILLRPISKHLGRYLEAKAEEGRALPGRSKEDLDRIFTLLEGVGDRLERLEEKQEFTDRLLDKPRDGNSGD